jgi:hypothetical protein
MGRAEFLYEQLTDAIAIDALLKQPEDSYLDCKEWPDKDEDAQKVLAKAACGLTNADGGVIVIGMKAASRPKDEPDDVTTRSPVKDTSLVRSRILGLISNLVEPGIPGIDAREIPESPGASSGFVVVLVPKSDGSPRRSRKHRDFFIRVGSATIPMEYWQIEDMFGRRAHPKLSLHLSHKDRVEANYPNPSVPVRWFHLELHNEGRGIAKFPGLRFRRDMGFILSDAGADGEGNFGIPLRQSEKDWIVFRGGMDDVIYPGETRLIGVVSQEGRSVGIDESIVQGGYTRVRWVFDATEFRCEISTEGATTMSVGYPVPEDGLPS